MRIYNKNVRKVIKAFYRIAIFKKIIDKALFLLFGNKIYRRFCTQNFSSKKLAIGEMNRYGIESSWITVDLAGADFNVDFRFERTLPKAPNSVSLIYCSHVFEHLSDDTLLGVLAECHRLLEPGGTIRIEAPDVLKIISAFKHNDLKFFYNIMSNKEKKYSSVEKVFMGLLACYIDNGVHIPVNYDPNLMQKKLHELEEEDFARWAISLMSKEEIITGGHINTMSYLKISKFLQNTGFSRIIEVQTGESNSVEMLKELKGIERTHRGFYSVIIEATKS
ncbi:methyltransferase domain-containing protein [Amylibacter sp.]|nr:methyltransferase domain-containing protein [Amylibacter sp.]